jgi:hypothetical protein
LAGEGGIEAEADADPGAAVPGVCFVACERK